MSLLTDAQPDATATDSIRSYRAFGPDMLKIRTLLANEFALWGETMLAYL
ncbi:MAG: hypothetical protein QHJ34_06720 [bacterium]|nr:hypothetical protein [bacterium]